MTTVKQLLQGKGHEVWCIGPDASVYDAVAMMADKEVGALVIMEGESLVGVLSERDYARKVLLQGRSSKTTKIREIMTSRVAYARPEQSVEDCMAMMTEKRIRHLPVMEGEKLLGMISIGDLVKAIIEEQQHVIEQLEQYITR
ncbi:MAG: CBS domain-containing protein [Gammaproteobacteria bacterium]|nr:CBS domain-containing protein [Gammaproteobacteria bacterium]NIN37779.1 CBS domain-containing protein [Gammaproteobacteria bacterium]NIO23439.1 CBS domain-containing protein [Gammaproteobacteria bacterium]NIO64055.1 CBS domain-containing protein [Gammaproteobacteria bacterium]NIP47083.1 CBS domain-containing protein [Gammaproteobacteria bacterium]